jgi:sugar/nucleoside kinase (ribokinase family)
MKNDISIAIIGSINLDIVASVKDFPQPGETVTNAVVNRFPGGKGANQALAAHRLGASVFMVGRVGKDPAADEALQTLREEEVDLTFCKPLNDFSTGWQSLLYPNQAKTRSWLHPVPMPLSTPNILRFRAPMPASPSLKYRLKPS